MSVTTKPMMFVARDGREFEAAEAAERWDALVEATARLEEAATAWEIAAMETAVTADGQPFNVSRDCRYWQIVGGADLPAVAHEVRFYPRDIRLADGWREGVTVEYVWTDPWRHDKRRTVAVSDLYSSKAAAEAAAYRMNVDRVRREYAELVRQGEDLGAGPPPVLDASGTT